MGTVILLKLLEPKSSRNLIEYLPMLNQPLNDYVLESNIMCLKY